MVNWNDKLILLQLLLRVKIIFVHHLAFIWSAVHGETIIFCDSENTREIFNHFIVFNLHLKFVDFQRVTPMEMSHFDMKISKFSNGLIFDVHVGNC